MKFTTILYAVPFALVAGQFQQAPALERIATLSYSGDGCPSNATTGGSVKGKRWTSSFSGFVAQSGPVTPIQARERSCSVSLTGKLPDGWSIAPSSLTPHYSFNLDTDVDFFLTNAANFGGQRSRVSWDFLLFYKQQLVVLRMTMLQSFSHTLRHQTLHLQAK